jgi:hypothetical protein
LNLITDDASSRFKAGKPYSAIVTVENVKQKRLIGLVKIELVAAGQKKNRWLWMLSGEKKEVLFKGLIAPKPGTYEVRCGNITKSLRVEQ